MGILKYTNGVGHLIMSIFMTLVGLALILVPNLNSGAQGVGIGLILAVQAAWFVSGGAKQVAYEVSQQQQQQQAIAPVIPVEEVTGTSVTSKIPVVQPKV